MPDKEDTTAYVESRLSHFIDLSQQPDSNLQHLRHVFEGYQCRVLGAKEGCPYAPQSARAESWELGWATASYDLTPPEPKFTLRIVRDDLAKVFRADTRAEGGGTDLAQSMAFRHLMPGGVCPLSLESELKALIATHNWDVVEREALTNEKHHE